MFSKPSSFESGILAGAGATRDGNVEAFCSSSFTSARATDQKHTLFGWCFNDPCHCYRGPPISARTFEGSFSAVWVPTIARVGAFFHIFRDLQDSHSFAPLHTQIFVNFSFLFLQFFHQISSFFANFESISRVFEQILMKICRNFTGLKNASQNFGEISNFDELGVRGLPKKLK